MPVTGDKPGTGDFPGPPGPGATDVIDEPPETPGRIVGHVSGDGVDDDVIDEANRNAAGLKEKLGLGGGDSGS